MKRKNVDFYFFQIFSNIFYFLFQILLFFWWGRRLRPPPKNIQGLGIFFLGMVDPSRNGLVSTAYFAKPGFSVLQYISISFDAYIKMKNNIFFSKMVKFTWQIRNRLNRKKNQISDFYFSSYSNFFGHFVTSSAQFSENFSRYLEK